MELENLQLAVGDDGIATITVNRPQVLNALNRATLAELAGVLDRLRDDASVRVLIVTGAGDKAFVAGADIKELAENSPLQSSLHARMGQRILDRLEKLGKPSIAAVNGYALGGGLELAMACTLRVASANAKLGLPEVTLGIIPGFGGTQRLGRLVGRGRALQLILTGKPISADVAAQWGLVTSVHAPGELMAAARDLATQLAAYSSVTLRIAEETVRIGQEMSQDDALALEASQFGLAAASDDYQEGMNAFLEKRKPAFRHR